MEGFVNNTFNQGFNHSNSYTRYGVDKAYLDKIREKNGENIDKTTVSEPFDITNISDNFDVAVDTVSTPNQNKNQRIKALAVIGASTAMVGAATLLLMKGKLTKSAAGFLNNIITNATGKIENLKNKPQISLLEGYYLLCLQKLNKTAYKMRGTIFNITPLKDVLFERFVKETCGLKKPCDAITKNFRKLSFTTVKSSYNKAGKNIDEMSDLFSATTKRMASGEFSRTPSDEVLEKLGKTGELIQTEFGKSFGERSIEGRSNMLVNKFSGLSKRVYDSVYGNIKGFVTDVNEWSTFVSERLVAKDKAKFMEELAVKKRILTNNPDDNYKLMDNILTKLENSIDPQHNDSRSVIKKLRILTDKYNKLSGANESENRAVLSNEIKDILQNASKLLKTESNTPGETKQVSTLIQNFEKVLNSDKKGAIEEMLTLFKEYLPQEEYLKLKKSAQKAINSLNKAVHTEGFEYVDKVRDLSIGSALTDVAIGMAMPLGTTTAAMATAKTKEKKRSVVLKYGLPLIAGVATSTLCTIKLISGGRALLLGSAVTVIGNEIFERIDNYLLAKENKQKES